MHKKTITLDFTRDEFYTLALAAHEEGVTFEDLINKLLGDLTGMNIKNKYKKALLNEVKRLQKINTFEENGLNIFEDLFWGGYDMFYIVLDKMGIPKDKKCSRDEYNNLYYCIWSDPNEITMETIDALIENCALINSERLLEMSEEE